MGFSRQGYGNGLSFPFPEDLPDPGIEPRSPALQADSLPFGLQGSPLYAEHIMRNAGLGDSQAGIKTAGRNINNLRYADDTTLMAKSKEELKSLLKKVKEESKKVGLNSTFKKTKIMASNPITPWQINREKVETVTDFSFLGSKITVDGDCNHEIKRRSWEEKL